MDPDIEKVNSMEKMLSNAQREYIIRAVLALIKDPHRKGLLEELEHRIEEKMQEALSEEQQEEVELERIIWAVAASVDEAVDGMMKKDVAADGSTQGQR